jgi:HAE1 family hydrophobic/amphiphilic exporter-1
MLLLGIVIVYLIMVAQFLVAPFPVYRQFTIPMAFTGGLLALFISGFEISVVAMIGFVLLVGIIVNNGIVLIDYINQLRTEGVERIEAIITAGTTRLRPVVMTAITTILGLVPLAIGIGLGADLMQPIAVVCIGGLVYATFMTLFIVPILYDILMKKQLRVVTKDDLTIADI